MTTPRLLRLQAKYVAWAGLLFLVAWLLPTLLAPPPITPGPKRRQASTVCTREFATAASMSATPVMSMTTTLARWARMARRSCAPAAAPAVPYA